MRRITKTETSYYGPAGVESYTLEVEIRLEYPEEIEGVKTEKIRAQLFELAECGEVYAGGPGQAYCKSPSISALGPYNTITVWQSCGLDV